MKGAHRSPKYSTRISNVNTDAVIVPRNDWKRIKKEATFLTPEMQREMNEKKKQETQKFMQTIQTKRSAYIQPNDNPEVKNHVRDVLNTVEEKDYALQIAEKKANNDLDEIKTVNSRVTIAKALNERQRQLKEHEEMKARERERERQMDQLMEKNRKEALDLYEERERILKEQRKAGRAIIAEQIEEHKINAILEAERLDREKKAMEAQNRRIREEDERRAAELLRRKQAFRDDCLDAREMSLRRKQMEREQEKEEAQMVIEFQAQKALREAALERERADQRALKEREIAELRKQQQRAIDTQAIRDEQMALKVSQQREEQDRQREEEERARANKIREEARKDREMMIASKRERLLQDALLEKQEHEKMLKKQAEDREKARKKYYDKINENNRYREELRRDVEAKEQSKRTNPQQKMEEARRLALEQKRYQEKVNQLTQERIEELRKEGVDERFIADVAKLTFQYN